MESLGCVFMDVTVENSYDVNGGGTITLKSTYSRLIATGAGIVAGMIAGAVVSHLGGGFFAKQVARVSAALITRFVTYLFANSKGGNKTIQKSLTIPYVKSFTINI